VTVRDKGDEFRRAAVLGGVAERLAVELGERTGKETRSLVLGHLQRGGGPSSADRVLAQRFAAAAINRFAQGCASGMIGLAGREMQLVPFEVAASGTRTVPLDVGPVLTARALGISVGDEDVGRFAASVMPPPEGV
jgi:6-phosphofructokinase 1